VLSGRGLCDELITRPEESYRLCCVVVCDLETSRMGAPYICDISHLRVKYGIFRVRMTSLGHWRVRELRNCKLCNMYCDIQMNDEIVATRRVLYLLLLLLLLGKQDRYTLHFVVGVQLSFWRHQTVSFVRLPSIFVLVDLARLYDYSYVIRIGKQRTLVLR